MKMLIDSAVFDEERALYHLEDAEVVKCEFAGPADGESALKEARNIKLKDCDFSLRYPMWHVRKFYMQDSRMEETARAALWYAEQGMIEKSTLGGIKAVRECSDFFIADCTIHSMEFGWKCKGITVKNSEIVSEYLFLDSEDVIIDHVKMKGKYSFQYMENLEVKDSELDTKDAFWHSRNVTVKDSVVKGEYLGWFSDGLTLINCRIIGTQPLCYCKNLKLINCTMEDCDLAFEYAEVTADVHGHIDSVKNPKSGVITADSVGEIIMEDAVMDCAGQFVLRKDSEYTAC